MGDCQQNVKISVLALTYLMFHLLTVTHRFFYVWICEMSDYLIRLFLAASSSNLIVSAVSSVITDEVLGNAAELLKDSTVVYVYVVCFHHVTKNAKNFKPQISASACGQFLLYKT